MVTIPTLRELLEAGVHFGHRSARWNPKMQKYIYAEKGGIHIINLEKTLELLKEADNFLSKAVAEGKTVLFVGTKKQAVDIVKKAAETAGMPYVIERWPGGLLTNFDVMKVTINKMVSMQKLVLSEDFEKMNKKEQSSFKNRLKRKETLFGGLSKLQKMPDILFLIDVPSQKIAVKESREIGVPIVALVDTNTNPETIDLPIPANDDATKSLDLLTNHIAKVIAENKPREIKESKKE